SVRIDRLPPHGGQPPPPPAERPRPRHAPAHHAPGPVRELGAPGETHAAPVFNRREVDRAAEGPAPRRPSPNSRATWAIGPRSTTRMSGLVGVSTKIARVVFRTVLRHCRGCAGSA